jgi:hypothetical protein
MLIWHKVCLPSNNYSGWLGFSRQKALTQHLRKFELMNMYTILKYHWSHTQSSYSIYLKTFPILKSWSNNSDYVILI